MTKQQKPRRMGRPPLPPGEKKLPSVGFRPTPALRVSLEDAAQRHGRSVSKEIESRLERSVQSDEAMGGPELYALFRLLGAAANLVEARTGKGWAGDWETFLAMRAAWESLIADTRPPTPKGARDKHETLRREKKALERELRELRHQPTMPDMTMLPGQGYFSKRSEAQLKEDEKARSDYDNQLREYNREITALMSKFETLVRRFEKQFSHFDELAELGEDVAAGLLRPEGEK